MNSTYNASGLPVFYLEIIQSFIIDHVKIGYINFVPQTVLPMMLNRWKGNSIV